MFHIKEGKKPEKERKNHKAKVAATFIVNEEIPSVF